MPDDWNDLYVRTALGERGPSDRQGALGSPDIIPAGVTPVDPQPFTSPQSWGGYVSNMPAQAGKPNYIYVRAKNSASTGTIQGKAYLDMTDPAVVLWPGGTGWTRIKTSGSQTYDSQLTSNHAPQIPAGAIAVTEDPFMWLPDSSGHRCLVTWLSTSRHPDPGPPPRITTVDELAAFLRAHPNYAHHNIDVTPNTTGAVTQSAPFSSGTLRATWAFGLRVENCRGFTVSFSSAKLLNGQPIVFGPVTVNQDAPITLTLDNLDIPVGWDTTFNYTYEQNAITPPNPFSVEFVAYYQPPPSSPSFRHALTASELGIAEGSVSASFRGIPLGSIGVMKGALRGAP